MPELNKIDSSFAQTDDFAVTAYPEQLDADKEYHTLWGYCLRIENNSAQRIRLLAKSFCITDDKGDNHYEFSQGFHGELPDLEPGEYFDFEDTALVEARAAVLYGKCHAIGADGRQFDIKIPVTLLSSATGTFNETVH